MNEYKTQYFWSVDVKMSTPSGEELNIKITEANFIIAEGEPSEARLSIKIDNKTYQRIDKLEAFNLKQDKRKESALEGFSENKPIEIELILDKSQITKLDSKVINAEKLIETLHKLTYSDLKAPLLKTENWFALNVKQEVDVPEDMKGSLKMGYATTWVEEFETKIVPTPFVQKIFDYFNKNTTNCQIVNTAFSIVFEYYYENKKWNCLLIPKEEYKQVILYIYSPKKIEKEKCMETCKEITKINYDLPIGNFELDLDNCEIRFKTYLESVNPEITDEELKLLLDANIYTINKFMK